MICPLPMSSFNSLFQLGICAETLTPAPKNKAQSYRFKSLIAFVKRSFLVAIHLLDLYLVPNLNCFKTSPFPADIAFFILLIKSFAFIMSTRPSSPLLSTIGFIGLIYNKTILSTAFRSFSVLYISACFIVSHQLTPSCEIYETLQKKLERFLEMSEDSPRFLEKV